MKIKILVACHKKDVMATQYPYEPIHVGKDLHLDIDLGITTDNTGDNISNKNASYCELTAMYWAWKNLKDVDVIGLCHYRRYFDFHHQCQSLVPLTGFGTNEFNSLDLSVPDKIIDEVSNGKIVVAKELDYYKSLAVDYCISHNSDDYRVMSHIVHATQEQKYIDAFESLMQGNTKMSNFNMFLMTWKDYDDYCTWLFDILSKVEKVTDISKYTTFQKRIYGYMAERLFNVWLIAEKKKLIKRPVIWVNNGKKESLLKRVRHVLKSLYCSVLFSLGPKTRINPDLKAGYNAFYMHNK